MDDATGLPEGVVDAFPVTPAQAGMVFHTLEHGAGAAYFGQFTALLPADLDLARFKQAWDHVVARHDALRSQIVWEGFDEPIQVIHDKITLDWTELDWSGADDATAREALETYLTELRTEGVDIGQAPPMRMILIQRAGGRRLFVWMGHHAFLDGWSIRLVMRDVEAIYARLAEGGPEPERPAQFQDFVHWLAGADRDGALSFWRDRLAGFDTPVRLSFERPDGAPGESVFPELEAQLSGKETQALNALCGTERTTLSALIEAAWAIVLSHASGRDDVLFGSASSQRNPEIDGVDEIVGNFVATLPVRARLDQAADLRALIRQRTEMGLAERAHAFVALAEIRQVSDVPGGDAMFDTIVAMEGGPKLHGGAPAVFHDLTEWDQSNFPLALLVYEGAELRLLLKYDPTVYSDAAARALLSMVGAVLRAMPEHLGTPVFEVPVMDAEATARALAGDCSQVPLPPFGLVHDEILARARERPTGIAVETTAGALTYQELADRSEALAGVLAGADIGPSRRVAIFMHRCPEMIVALLGVLRSGNAYVPIDAANPAEHSGRILADCGAQVVLTMEDCAGDLPDTEARVIRLDAPLPQRDRPAQGPEVTPQDGAYVIYTSGSTGAPKGVDVRHATLSASTAARLAAYDETPRAFLLVSPFSFDSSVAGIFWTLCTGGKLVLPPPGAVNDANLLSLNIAHSGVTHTLCLPQLWSAVLDGAQPDYLSSLRVVICAGDELQRGMVQRHRDLMPGVRLYNEYGPTEATVWCTWHEFDSPPARGRVPIGGPIPGARVYLRDARGQPVPDGLPGELYVAGQGIAAGYIGQPAETAARFVPDFTDPEARCYRTGDLVRRAPSGALTYLGRADTQVKIRGHRLEPGEVEARFTGAFGIDEAVVRCFGAGDATRLVLFATGDFAPDATLAAAKKTMPAWMVPAQIVPLETFPQTANGKIDRKALADPGLASGPHDRVPPATDLERALAEIWKQVLWIERDIGVTEDFFDLGGHSLASMRLVSAISNQLGMSLPPTVLGRLSTVRAMAEEIEAAQAAPEAPPPMLPSGGSGAFEGLPQEAIEALHAYSASWPGEPLMDGSLIRVLNREGRKPPLYFWFNSAHEFSSFAEAAGPDQPVYGIRTGAHLVDHAEVEMQYTRQRQVALYHLEHILAADPHGPYYFAGMCQGAIVAVNVALILQGLRKPVPFIAMLEKTPPQPFSGHVAVIYGRDSFLNPYRYFEQPELVWAKKYRSFSVDIVDGDYGRLFRGANVKVLAGALLGRLEEAKARPISPLPDDGFAAAISVADMPDALAPGQSVPLTVTLRNDSPRLWGATPDSGLRVTNRWLFADGAVAFEQDGAAPLAGEIAPGGEGAAVLTVTAPGDVGSYRLEIDLVEEGVTRFADRGSTPFVTDMRIDPSAKAPPVAQPDTATQADLSEPALPADAANLADIAVAQGNHWKAVRAFGDELGGIGQRYVLFGMSQLDVGDAEAAEVSFQNALALGHETAEAWEGLGRARIARWRNLAAIGPLRRSLALQEDASVRRALRLALRRNIVPRPVYLALRTRYRAIKAARRAKRRGQE